MTDPFPPLDVVQHRKHHQAMDKTVRELATDYLVHNPFSLTQVTVSMFLQWASDQAQWPTPIPPTPEA